MTLIDTYLACVYTVCSVLLSLHWLKPINRFRRENVYYNSRGIVTWSKLMITWYIWRQDERESSVLIGSPSCNPHWPWARDICWYFCVKSLHEEKFVIKFCENWTFWCDTAMAMLDKSNILDFPGRPRRIVQSPGKNYDGEGERNLTLPGIFEVLGTYRDYEGGINCSRCGEIIFKRFQCSWQQDRVFYHSVFFSCSCKIRLWVAERSDKVDVRLMKKMSFLVVVVSQLFMLNTVVKALICFELENINLKDVVNFKVFMLPTAQLHYSSVIQWLTQ